MPKETGVFLALLILITIFSVVSQDFLTLRTFGSIFTVCTEIGIISLGATLLMIAGEFDLSVGSNFAFSGMIFAMLITNEVNSLLAFTAALGTGAGIGCVNGLITLHTRIPSFITTLGTMMLFRGLVLLITDGFPLSVSENALVMDWLASDLHYGFKSSIFVWILLSIFFIYLLAHHPLGNQIMATGGNEQAAFSMGIRVKSLKLLCFVISGTLASLSGIIQFSHLQSLSPTSGEQYELRAIAIAVIGGTLLTGGAGTIKGTILGTIIMGVLASGLVQAGISTYWFRALVGLILVLAVIMNTNLQRFKERAA